VTPTHPRSTTRRNHSLVLFDRGDEIVVQAGPEGIRFLLVSGKPLEEPVAWYGPIVMNTQAELRQAVNELQSGNVHPPQVRQASFRLRAAERTTAELSAVALFLSPFPTGVRIGRAGARAQAQRVVALGQAAAVVASTTRRQWNQAGFEVPGRD
jgi:hypothetical protein